MIINATTDQLLDQFDKVKKEIEARLKMMVGRFCYEIAKKAIDITPFGSEEWFKYFW